MAQYLPFGTQIVPTEEQIKEQELKFEQYDYYGIPYGIFDDSNDGEGNLTKKDIDREKARLLIMKREIIPDDLKVRLLQYKEQDLIKQKQ
jgi:hypothetical protein